MKLTYLISYNSELATVNYDKSIFKSNTESNVQIETTYKLLIHCKN